MATYDALIRDSGLPRHEAMSLFLHVEPTLTREWLIAHGDTDCSHASTVQFTDLAAERANGYPLAYLLGWREFYGRAFTVNESVLIPRADTETLVQWAIDRAPRDADVLELGTGSGAIAVTLACERPDLRLTATDLANAALTTARGNAERHACSERIRWLASDWFNGIPAEPAFDLIITNPPYIAPNDPHLNQGDLRFEPDGALKSAPDGLAAIRTIAQGARSRLRVNGWLATEHGYDQAVTVRNILAESGFKTIESARDLAANWRISWGQQQQSL